MAMKCDNCIHKQVCKDKPPESYPQFMIDIMTDKCENYIHTAYVQPVKHGRWIETHISLIKYIPEDEKEEGYSFYMAELKCSCCERYNVKTFALTLNKPDFCQLCGAKMDGDRDD